MHGLSRCGLPLCVGATAVPRSPRVWYGRCCPCPTSPWGRLPCVWKNHCCRCPPRCCPAAHPLTAPPPHRAGTDCRPDLIYARINRVLCGLTRSCEINSELHSVLFIRRTRHRTSPGFAFMGPGGGARAGWGQEWVRGRGGVGEWGQERARGGAGPGAGAGARSGFFLVCGKGSDTGEDWDCFTQDASHVAPLSRQRHTSNKKTYPCWHALFQGCNRSGSPFLQRKEKMGVTRVPCPLRDNCCDWTRRAAAKSVARPTRTGQCAPISPCRFGCVMDFWKSKFSVAWKNGRRRSRQLALCDPRYKQYASNAHLDATSSFGLCRDAPCVHPASGTQLLVHPVCT